MIPKTKQTPEQTAKIEQLSQAYPKTGRAYRIVSAFDDFFACLTREEAEKALTALISWMRRCRLEPMKEAADTLKRHKENILAYFDCRMTNAICEGLNAMIQAAKRKARGYRTFEGYAAMIYLVCGKLKLNVPSPFLSTKISLFN
jgi:transposase